MQLELNPKRAHDAAMIRPEDAAGKLLTDLVGHWPVPGDPPWPVGAWCSATWLSREGRQVAVATVKSQLCRNMAAVGLEDWTIENRTVREPVVVNGRSMHKTRSYYRIVRHDATPAARARCLFRAFCNPSRYVRDKFQNNPCNK